MEYQAVHPGGDRTVAVQRPVAAAEDIAVETSNGPPLRAAADGRQHRRLDDGRLAGAKEHPRPPATTGVQADAGRSGRQTELGQQLLYERDRYLPDPLRCDASAGPDDAVLAATV